MFKVEKLACRRGMRHVFRGVTFALEPGAFLLVTGENGSGKSSLLRILAGLLPAADGKILWEGTDVATDWPAHRAGLHYIGHQDAVKHELTAIEMLEYWQALRGTKEQWNSPPLEGGVRGGVYEFKNFMPPPPNLPLKGGGTRAVLPANSVLEAFNLAHLANKPTRYLSAGQKRRLALTRLVLDDAPLWLLDEPTTALDHHAQKILGEVITAHRAKGGIVIAAMHHPSDLPKVQTFAMPEVVR